MELAENQAGRPAAEIEARRDTASTAEALQHINHTTIICT